MAQFKKFTIIKSVRPGSINGYVNTYPSNVCCGAEAILFRKSSGGTFALAVPCVGLICHRSQLLFNGIKLTI